MDIIEKMILKKLRDGPRWANSFRHCKPVIVRLVERGSIIRIAPPGSKSRNMLSLPTGDEHAK